MPVLLVNMQLVEQTAANRAQERFDGFGIKVGQNNRAAGAFIVAAGGAEPVDDRVQCFTRPASQRARTE